MKTIREMDWRGERVVLLDYKPSTLHETWGFEMKQCFVVRDAMDEPCLPISQGFFWSPGDAIAAIEMRDVIAPEIGAKSIAHEYNQMRIYRANFDVTYRALARVRKLLFDADKNMDDIKTEDVRAIFRDMLKDINTRRVA